MKPLTTLPTEPGQKPPIYACAHWRSFPPPFSGSGMSPQELRTKGMLRENDYQRMLVWQKMCGLFEMETGQCMKCPHIRIAEFNKRGLPVLTTLDGTLSVPAVDMPTMELNARQMANHNRVPKAHLEARPLPAIVGKIPGGPQGGNG